MVKSKESATAASGAKKIYTMNGWYYEGMRDLFMDDDGHISLDAEDYEAFPKAEIVSFLADLDYETGVIFSPDGKLIHISSEFEPGYTVLNLRDAADVIRGHDPTSTGDGYEYMHFHTLAYNEGAYPVIFSRGDIAACVNQTNVGINGYGLVAATAGIYTATAHNGSRFSLEYVGNAKRDRKNFAKAYSAALTKANKEAAQEWMASGRAWDDAGVSAKWDRKADAWLKSKAHLYGYKYTSNL